MTYLRDSSRATYPMLATALLYRPTHRTFSRAPKQPAQQPCAPTQCAAHPRCVGAGLTANDAPAGCGPDQGPMHARLQCCRSIPPPRTSQHPTQINQTVAIRCHTTRRNKASSAKQGAKSTLAQNLHQDAVPGAGWLASVAALRCVNLVTMSSC